MTGRKKNLLNKGVTLVEITIVLAILALLLAGVVSVGNIREQYQLRSIVADLQNYKNAITMFDDIYNALPGDYSDPNSELGLGGDGDGRIEFSTSNLTPVEDLIAWYHLRVADLIKGNYTGVAVATQRYNITGNTPNAPSTYFDNGIYAIATDTAQTYYGKSGTYISLGELSTGLPHANYIAPLNALFVDTKIDDGLASRGKLYTVRGEAARVAVSGCVDAGISATSANYITADNAQTKSCILLFWQD